MEFKKYKLMKSIYTHIVPICSKKFFGLDYIKGPIISGIQNVIYLTMNPVIQMKNEKAKFGQ